MGIDKQQKKRLLYALDEVSNEKAFILLIIIFVKSKLGFLRGSPLLSDRRTVQCHMINDRRRHSPRLIYFISYVAILYTVIATIVLIASQNMQNGILFFSLFVIPLYFVIRKPMRLKNARSIF